MIFELLQTKCLVPPHQPQRVSRFVLLNRLDEAVFLGHRLILVSAPAGYGKTTLINEWVHKTHGQYSIAWLSLDADDNNPIRFWAYLIKALQGITPHIGQKELQHLATDCNLPILVNFQDSAHDPHSHINQIEGWALAPLLNQMAGFPEKTLLVLDDYHQVSNPAIHAGVAYLIEHLPPQIHLVVISRVDPPLPVVALRARGQLTELRASDLSFTVQEAATFLNRLTGKDFSSQDVEILRSRTEGWIAGLQMAGLTIQALKSQFLDQQHGELDAEIGHFIHSFSGKHHFIIDYMVTEVLQRQPDFIQEFLIKTSILERLNSALCDCVVDLPPGTDPTPGRRSQDILDHLERSNLFLIPLDTERGWYRYHHLFADLLVSQLRQTHLEWAPALHRRASKWYESNGHIDQAIFHAIEGMDWDDAARLLEYHAGNLFRQGELDRVIKWIELVPEKILRSRPKLCLRQAWGYAFSNRWQAIDPLLRFVEDGLNLSSGAGRDLSPEIYGIEEQRIKAEVALLRAYLAMAGGDRSRALDITLQGIAVVPDSCLPERSILFWMAGFISGILRDSPRAVHFLHQAVQLARSMDDFWLVMISLTDLASVYHTQGRLNQAEITYRDAIRVASEHGTSDHGYLSRVEASLAAILCEQNRLDEALELATHGVAKTAHWQNSNHVAWAYGQLARVLQASGKLEEAGQVLKKAEAVVQKSPVLWGIKAFVEICRVRWWMAQGHFAIARRWADDFRSSFTGHTDLLQPMIEADELRLLVYIRVLLAGEGSVGIASGQEDGENRIGTAQSLQEALDFLDRLRGIVETHAPSRCLLEVLTLQALAHYHCSILETDKAKRAKYYEDALAALEKSLALAEGEGFTRLYIDEGETMKNLLAAISRRPATITRKTYLGRLLSAFRDSPGPGEVSPVYGQETPLVEPLSSREIEVLRLMANGCSADAMAQKLVLSPGTIKSHIAHIYRKLDVHNRTQALAVARALHFLDR
jgi:LuxR family maltose regulon positive regulatory protein